MFVPAPRVVFSSVNQPLTPSKNWMKGEQKSLPAQTCIGSLCSQVIPPSLVRQIQVSPGTGVGPYAVFHAACASIALKISFVVS